MAANSVTSGVLSCQLTQFLFLRKLATNSCPALVKVSRMVCPAQCYVGESRSLIESSFLGATNAMQDAVILANCIRDLETASVADIKACFEDYRAQRYPHVKKQHATSQLTAKLSYGHVNLFVLLFQVSISAPKSLTNRLFNFFFPGIA